MNFNHHVGTSDSILGGSRWPPIIFGAVSISLRWNEAGPLTRPSGGQYYKLCFVGDLGHSNGMEMDLLHHLRSWFWTQWSLHGVSCFFLAQ